MRLFSRIFLVFILTFVSGVSQAQDVPYTSQGYVAALGGALGIVERETCDEDFLDVMEARAWEEAQREITQNANIIRRPDSVLSMTCFGDWLDHLADYSDSNFPGDPNATGNLDGVWLDLALFTRYETLLEASDLAIGGGGDPYLARGLYLYATLEILVLDQLVDDVTELGKIADDVSLLNCEKDYYITDNFHDLMIGGRARAETDAPTQTALGAYFDEHVRESANYNGCALMNQVWMRSKCYDFATESDLDVHRVDAVLPNGTPVGTGTMNGAQEHDAFYQLSTYEGYAGAGNDYRKIRETRNTTVALGDSVIFGTQCPIPDENGYYDNITGGDTGDIVTYLGCAVIEHGLNFPTNWESFFGLLGLDDNPYWDTAFDDANPLPGTDGAVDPYIHYLELRDPATCAPPIRVGYIVTAENGDTYIDAVCPTPGCWFNPPSDTTSEGTCSN